MASIRWGAPTDGSWLTAGNWEGLVLPGVNDTALIDQTGTDYTVTLAVNFTDIGGLQISSADATLAINNGGFLYVVGLSNLQAGTIDISGASLFSNDLQSSPSTVIDVAGDGSFEGQLDLQTAEIDQGLLESTSGTGLVVGALVGAGTVEAAGGTLDLQSGIIPSELNFQVSNNIASILQMDGTVDAGAATFTFLGPDHGEFLFNNNTAAVSASIDAMNVGSSATTPTNFVGLAGSWDVTGGSAGSGTSGVVTLFNGTTTDTLDLSGITEGGSAATGTWVVNADTTSNPGTTDVFLSVVCFAAGTHIRTPTGEKLVESLAPGDIVFTLTDGQLGPQAVTWIGRRRIDLALHPRPEVVAPVRIQRDALAENVPHTDLLLSPDHAVFVDGKLICARQLINGTTIRQERDLPSIEYFHVELDAHAILVAEGLPAESYLNTGNHGFFANSGEPLVLHPDLTDETDYPKREAGSCAPFVSDEASVRPVWQRLVDRAADIGQPLPQRATTTDPGLHLRSRRPKQANGKPIHQDDNLAIFVVPRGSREIRLISRAQSPTETRPWLDDRRSLGVRVTRIVLRSADELREIPMDHPDLTKGWWAIERDGQAMSRWTNGDAVVPLPAMDGPVMLEVHLAGKMIYAVEAKPESQAERHAA